MGEDCFFGRFFKVSEWEKEPHASTRVFALKRNLYRELGGFRRQIFERGGIDVWGFGYRFQF